MTYKIIDEPAASAYNNLAVQPLWPLFAIMLGGTWLSFPWFVVNGFAIGCPNRMKTLGLAVLGFVGTGLILLATMYFAATYEWDQYAVQYALLVLTTWKLGVAYWLYVIQARTFSLYQYFGGVVRNGLLVVGAGWFLGNRLLVGLPTFIQIVLR